MESILVVSTSPKGTQMLINLLKQIYFAPITTAENGGEARRLLCLQDFNLVIINSPLSDEFGHDLASHITQLYRCGVMVIVKSEMADEISQKLESSGVFVMEKPFNSAYFRKVIRLVEATNRRILGLKKENDSLQFKLEEIRIINRAKCVLIEYLKMTEQQAHRYIEKQAMDMRLSRKEISLSILKTYEM